MLTFITLLLVQVQQPEAYSFPYGSCSDKKCGSSPYEFTWVSKVLSNDLSQGTFCFHISTRTCNNSEFDCCDTFRQSLNKFVIHTQASCKPALLGVTVNGVAKRGGVFYDVYTDADAELRVTALSGINLQTANQTRICISLKAPCIPLHNFCRLKNGLCYISVWETKKHQCCPRCTMQDAIPEDDEDAVPIRLPAPAPAPAPLLHMPPEVFSQPDWPSAAAEPNAPSIVSEQEDILQCSCRCTRKG